MRGLLVIYIALNALASLPLALLVKRDFRRTGKVSMPVALWSGAAMHGHALATFLLAWVDRGSLVAPSLWTVLPGVLLLLAGTGLIWLGRRAYGDVARVYGLREDELIERGIYRFSRNPQYAGYGLMFLGAAVAGGSVLALLTVVLFLVFIRFYITGVEEPHMRLMFGAEYEAYCTRVARWFGKRSDIGQDAS